MATGMVVQFLAPIFYQQAGDASDSQRNANVSSLSWRLTGFTLCATALLFTMAILFHALIFRVLVAKEYALVSYLLPWVILAGGVFSAGQSIALNLASQMKTRTMIAAKVTTALLGSTFNIAGAYWYGITGIVIASILFSVLYFFWMLVLSKQQGIEICFQK
jgi:O-antigen/teichoic acid export membrane protein